MKISCGVIIINEQEEMLMGHSTGNKFYDIPKGMLEENENPVCCALRECEEETSIILHESELKDLGEFKYNKEKNLHLFLVKRIKDTIDVKALVCNSMFEHFYTKKLQPEVDSFKWVSLNEINEHCAKSMGKLLGSLKEEGKLTYSQLNVKP